MNKQVLSRRKFMVMTAAAGTGAMVAACAPATPQVVEKIVKETVVVQGTAQVVEKVVKETVQVETTKVVEKVVTPTAVPGPGAHAALPDRLVRWTARHAHLADPGLVGRREGRRGQHRLRAGPRGRRPPARRVRLGHRAGCLPVVLRRRRPSWGAGWGT